MKRLETRQYDLVAGLLRANYLDQVIYRKEGPELESSHNGNFRRKESRTYSTCVWQNGTCGEIETAAAHT